MQFLLATQCQDWPGVKKKQSFLNEYIYIDIYIYITYISIDIPLSQNTNFSMNMYIYIYIKLPLCTYLYIYTEIANKILFSQETEGREMGSKLVVFRLQRKTLAMTSSRNFHFFWSMFWNVHGSLTSGTVF